MRRLEGEALSQSYNVNSDMYHHGNEILVWGLINSSGPVELVRIHGRLNAEKYIEILKNNVSNKKKLVLGDYVFQHDNAPCHTAGIIKEYCAKWRISCLKWPSKSPDMNPIEHVWAFMKSYLFKKRDKINSPEDVWNYSQKIFFSKKCKDLIKNMY